MHPKWIRFVEMEGFLRAEMAEVNIVGRPVLMWVLDYLSTNKEDSIFLAVPAPILKQYDIKKMLVRLLPQASWWANIADAF